MIKRTGEKVLSWIGNILHLLYLGFIVLMVSMMGNKDFKDEMINSSQSSNPNVSSDQLNQYYGMLSSMGTGFIIFLIALLILAIIGTILISKKPKVAGILLIIAGIIGIFTSFIAGILWLIAGIMLLARKPKDDIYNHNGDYANNEYQSNNNHERYENGDQQVNEKNNSFILSEEDKKNEQQDIKEHYSNDSHNDTQNVNENRDNHANHQDNNHQDLNANTHKDNDFIDKEEQLRKDKKEEDPFKY
ncbi:DUF4064 domain-containing protein [Staphylococcus caprae]|uniref:DUF4064 domain-containing protein n=1 Tax=Staphylococcus caprae TaxID=29380 RepID=A0ABM7FU65_9STAP|nr:DUF4064 domain-containing protein [Staphylococcus caprae]EES41636.1 hypothetical protein HMPREF0793_0748 [Staphylococcus caprae M23864:W1]MBN6826412.1 DUF4064 domain-containing protein [Staphylococcus caprae]MBX5317782.1 DUF4064 domain-containing protein [Staphylococcus caprae]MBX5323390.1 DUF4064 domain-containing protein [Staphylococcus caprae]MCI2955107.1 DUF4064 domain-containing protein [Staphylococcus caprae]